MIGLRINRTISLKNDNWNRIKTSHKQECIPVGCVPPTAVAISPAMHAPPHCHCHTCPPAMHTSPAMPAPFAMHTPCHAHPPSPTCPLHHACHLVDRQKPVKTIPPQPSFAGGKKSFSVNLNHEWKLKGKFSCNLGILPECSNWAQPYHSPDQTQISCILQTVLLEALSWSN